MDGFRIEFVIALVMLGLLTYELLSGEVINEKSKRRVVSRNKHPGIYWFVIGSQFVFLLWMLLEFFGIVDII